MIVQLLSLDNALSSFNVRTNLKPISFKLAPLLSFLIGRISCYQIVPLMKNSSLIKDLKYLLNLYIRESFWKSLFTKIYSYETFKIPYSQKFVLLLENFENFGSVKVSLPKLFQIPDNFLAYVVFHVGTKLYFLVT